MKYFSNRTNMFKRIQEKGSTRRVRENRQPIYVGVFMLTILVMSSFFMGEYLANKRKILVRNDLLQKQKKFSNQFISSLNERLHALDRMASRFVDSSDGQKKTWIKDSVRYFEYFDGFQAIEWADSSTKLHWIYPLKGNEAAIGLVLNKEGKRKKAIDYAKKQRRGSLTQPINLKQGGLGFLSLHPTYGNGTVNGYIVGVYRAKDLLEKFTDENVLFQVYFGEQLVYNQLGDELNHSPSLNEFHKVSHFNIRNMNINLKSIPSAKLKEKLKLDSLYFMTYGLYILSLFLAWGSYILLKFKISTEEANYNYKVLSLAVNESALLSETDLTGKITFVNQKFFEISKYSAEELIGKDHRVVNSGEHSKSYYEGIWKTILSGNVWTGEIRNKAKGGGSYWVSSTIHPKVGKTGKVEGFISIQYDITEKKQQEFEIIQAKNDAIRAEKVKAEFLANMSHEIRTPMNGILGMVQLLSDTTLNEEQKSMLETTRNCGDSLLIILNDILDISKIESGKLDLELINFDLSQCLEEAIFLCMESATNKGIYLSFDHPEDDHLWFIGDITRIRQIIVNFLSNAVKFTHAGGVSVFVRKSEHKNKQIFLEIEVKDTGIGMSENETKRLFKAFSQVDSSTTRKYGGTGLGLYISHRLAQAMGGSIAVKSKKGEGTSFILDIPLITGVIKKQNIEKVEAHSFDQSRMASLIPHKILLVEDNSVNQRLASIMLKKLGYDCDIAANGYEALDALEALELKGVPMYTVIFMDMQMPEMDGIEATKKIVEIYGDMRPHIIAMTANVFSADKEKCFQAGMVDFVAKPIKQKDFRIILTKYAVKKINKSAV